MANLNFTIPLATLVGDLLQAHVMSNGGDSTGSPPPSGWTFVRKISINSSSTDDVYTKTAVLADIGAAVSWTVTGVAAAAGVILVVSNTTGEDDYKASAFGANTVTATPGVFGPDNLNVTAIGELMLCWIIVAGNVSLTPPAPWVVIRRVASTNVSLLFCQAAATASGPQTGFQLSLGATPLESFAAMTSFLGPTSILNTFAVA